MFNLALMKGLRKHKGKLIGLTIVIVVGVIKACV